MQAPAGSAIRTVFGRASLHDGITVLGAVIGPRATPTWSRALHSRFAPVARARARAVLVLAARGGGSTAARGDGAGGDGVGGDDDDDDGDDDDDDDDLLALCGVTLDAPGGALFEDASDDDDEDADDASGRTAIEGVDQREWSDHGGVARDVGIASEEGKTAADGGGVSGDGGGLELLPTALLDVILEFAVGA